MNCKLSESTLAFIRQVRGRLDCLTELIDFPGNVDFFSEGTATLLLLMMSLM